MQLSIGTSEPAVASTLYADQLKFYNFALSAAPSTQSSVLRLLTTSFTPSPSPHSLTLTGT